MKKVFTSQETKTIYYNEKLKEIISSKNGLILDGDYFNGNSKFKIECEKNHIWTTRAASLLAGKWCHS